MAGKTFSIHYKWNALGHILDLNSGSFSIEGVEVDELNESVKFLVREAEGRDTQWEEGEDYSADYVYDESVPAIRLTELVSLKEVLEEEDEEE